MIANRLKELRKKNNLTQSEFAKRFNISNGAIGNWESEKRQPDLNTLKKIADFFNVSVDYILGRTDSPTPTTTYHFSNDKNTPLQAEVIDLTKEEIKKVSEYIQFLKSQRTKRIHLAPGTEIAAQGGDFVSTPKDDETELL